MVKITSAAFFLLSVISAVVAAPATSQADEPLEAIKRASENHCGHSTFENQWSRDSALVSDCRRMMSNIAGGGTWTTITGPQRQLVQYGSCAFGVEGSGVGSFKVGNQDIIDLVTDSINKFQREGKVGSLGRMSCKGDLETNVVLWGLY